MKLSITKGLEKDQAEEVTLAFKSSGVIRERLIKIAQDKITTADKASMSDSGYDNPNWAYKQADTQGYKRAISEIISILK